MTFLFLQDGNILMYDLNNPLSLEVSEPQGDEIEPTIISPTLVFEAHDGGAPFCRFAF